MGRPYFHYEGEPKSKAPLWCGNWSKKRRMSGWVEHARVSWADFEWFIECDFARAFIYDEFDRYTLVTCFLQSILVGLSLAMQDFPSMWPVAIHSSNEGVWEGRIARVDSRSNKRPRNWGWLRWRVQYLEIQKLKKMRVKSLHKMITKCLVTQSPGESALLSTCTVEDNVSTQQWYANKIKEVYNFRNILPVGFFVNPSQTLKLACLIGKFQIFWSRMSRFCCFVKPGLTTNRYLMQ